MEFTRSEGSRFVVGTALKIRLRNGDQVQRLNLSGESIPIYMEGCESRGTVYRNGRTGSMIEVAQIEGKIFETMKEIEAPGLELAPEWVDRRWLGL